MQRPNPMSQNLLAHLGSKVNSIRFDSFFIILDRLQGSSNLSWYLQYPINCKHCTNLIYKAKLLNMQRKWHKVTMFFVSFKCIYHCFLYVRPMCVTNGFIWFCRLYPKAMSRVKPVFELSLKFISVYL